MVNHTGQLVELLKNVCVMHNSTGIFDPKYINTIQLNDSTSTEQDGIFDPISQNTIFVKNETQFKNSTHI